MRVWSAVLVLVLLYGADASAQEASWGVKGGANFATLSAETDPGPDFGYRIGIVAGGFYTCLLYTSPSPRDGLLSRMPSSA